MSATVTLADRSSLSPPAARTGPTADTPAARACGVHAARLNLADYAPRFGDSAPALTAAQAQIEAERCYGCFDAPCIAACPTGIDIPRFIQRISQGNLRGAARAILEANPLGGMCARVCPTDILCEGACVRHTNEDKPVEIGLLQRHATDALMASAASMPGAVPLFTRAARTGRRVAVVGAGPAGLACAHGLARRGHEVSLFDARPKAGGLNEYGIAAYKTPDNFAQREVEWLMSIGGITLEAGRKLGDDLTLDSLLSSHDAVFLGVGLAGVNALGLTDPAGQGLALRDAVDAIADIRQASDLSALPVGRHVVVIGGGMTAVDAAVQSALLGAETVHMVYRRGPEAMGASAYELRWAQTHGVQIHHWAAPEGFELDAAGRIFAIRFSRTRLVEGRLTTTADTFTLHADQVLRAIGQTLVTDGLPPSLALKAGRIATDADGRTSLSRVWAGGDCRHGGRDLTVEAVEHGKRSAAAIHDFLATWPAAPAAANA
jgi:dihydropyrimidine dehydrogenase (NAD+) subunit PreT